MNLPHNEDPGQTHVTQVSRIHHVPPCCVITRPRCETAGLLQQRKSESPQGLLPSAELVENDLKNKNPTRFIMNFKYLLSL